MISNSMQSEDEEEHESDNYNTNNISASQKTQKEAHEQSINEEKLCPSFTNYLYFLFAPTLVYRDTYTR